MTKVVMLVILATSPLACAAQSGAVPDESVGTTASASRPQSPGTALPRFPLRSSEERTFHVGAGDVLNISVWEEPQLATRAIVRPDGYISMPLVDEVQVSGLTPEQIQKLLTERVTRVVKHPRVSVVVEEIHSRLVYITGETQHPGAYPLTENINVMQLIARSGGPTEYAHRKKIFVLRQTTGQKMKVNYDRLLKGRDVEENIALLPGDMVVIP